MRRRLKSEAADRERAGGGSIDMEAAHMLTRSQGEVQPFRLVD